MRGCGGMSTRSENFEEERWDARVLASPDLFWGPDVIGHGFDGFPMRVVMERVCICETWRVLNFTQQQPHGNRRNWPSTSPNRLKNRRGCCCHLDMWICDRPFSFGSPLPDVLNSRGCRGPPYMRPATGTHCHSWNSEARAHPTGMMIQLYLFLLTRAKPRAQMRNCPETERKAHLRFA